jgi:hypothetical protein
MAKPRNVSFAADLRDKLDSSKILGVRAGTEHRFTGIWMVVVEGRLFARSWNNKPTGWFRAFRKEPDGTVQVAGIEIPVRARLTRSPRLREAVTVAYGEKYDTKAARKWVNGFAEPARELATLEFIPR